MYAEPQNQTLCSTCGRRCKSAVPISGTCPQYANDPIAPVATYELNNHPYLGIKCPPPARRLSPKEYGMKLMNKRKRR